MKPVVRAGFLLWLRWCLLFGPACFTLSR